MSWQLGAFAVLGLALAGGFAWYERARPDARIVALVATLAAFAALGRIAFAALPNVKPTTDIVLISGFALGGAPGFVVGALAGLTSNFFFGQGPWTPWQMAAWGVTGLIGAGLARISRGKTGRWRLALVCAVTGYAFAATQDVGDWVNFSDHSASQLGVYVGKGTGFDLVHAGGCLAFALAFGPALMRSIQRFATRLRVTWTPVVPAAVLAVPLAVALAAALAVPQTASAATPSSFLLAVQNTDGGFGATPGAGSSQLFAGWAALALAATGHNPAQVRNGGQSLIDYIRGAPTGDPGSLERTILVLRAAGLPAGGLVSQLQGELKSDGSVSDQVNLTSFAVLALESAGVTAPTSTIPWLARQQDQDGGFSFATAGSASDVDDTGAALEALAGSGRSGASARAVSFIRAQQNSDGGFPAQPGGDSNSQSTAWAVQGLLAAGVSGGSISRALGYLRSQTGPDGHVHYSSASDQTPVWVTAQAAMALAGKPLPLAPVATGGGRSPAGAGRAGARPAVAAGGRRGRKGLAHVRRPTHATNLDPLAAGAALLSALALAPIGAD